MSIQRWTFINGAEPHWLEEHPMGEYVTYADHVAAVAAAEERVKSDFAKYLRHMVDDDKFDAGVKAAREAVAAIEHWTSYTPNDSPWVCFASDPLAAIDGVASGKEGNRGD